MNNTRFGNNSINEIESTIKQSIPRNTMKTKKSAWEQFRMFLDARNYTLEKDTSEQVIAKILEDYGFNMKKRDGTDYTEASVKTLWNTTAQMVQEKYFLEFNIKIDPFKDITYKFARLARDTKRKKLQAEPETRKRSSNAFTKEELMEMVESYSEDNPDGLQKKFFHLCSFELAWRGNEAANCDINYFKKEYDNKGNFTGRVEYNPIFSKTTQGGSKALSGSKWLVRNNANNNLCPVRLFLKIIEKRESNPYLTTTRLFLTVHPNWEKGIWYKNSPLGINTISKWTKISAESIGIDTKKIKITNHSHRASAISALAKEGVGEQEVIKLTGHSSAHSLKPYLQLNEEHHFQLIENLRENKNKEKESSVSNLNSSQVMMQNNPQNNATTYNYNNCTFYINK